MKKKLLIGGIIYILALVSITLFNLRKGDSNYFGYKKQVEAARFNIDASNESKNIQPIETSQPSVTPQPTATPELSATPQPTVTPESQKVLVYSNVKFSRTLKKGMNGEDVKKLQELLVKNNLYSGDITGYFGNDTESALKKYQKSIKVTQDGVLGASSWNKLLE